MNNPDPKNYQPVYWIARVLWISSLLMLFGMASSCQQGDPKAFGSFVFAAFFLGIIGWMIDP